VTLSSYADKWTTAACRNISVLEAVEVVDADAGDLVASAVYKGGAYFGEAV